MRWPKRIISNEDLYLRCGTGPLSQQVQRVHRPMFSHVSCMPENTSAQLGLQFVVDGSNQYKGRVGRHTTNLLDMLRSDLSDRCQVVRLTEVAADWNRWNMGD